MMASGQQEALTKFRSSYEPQHGPFEVDHCLSCCL